MLRVGVGGDVVADQFRRVQDRVEEDCGPGDRAEPPGVLDQKREIPDAEREEVAGESTHAGDRWNSAQCGTSFATSLSGLAAKYHQFQCGVCYHV